MRNGKVWSIDNVNMQTHLIFKHLFLVTILDVIGKKKLITQYKSLDK